MKIKELAELIGVSEDSILRAAKRVGVEVCNGVPTTLNDVEVAKVVMEMKGNHAVRAGVSEKAENNLELCKLRTGAELVVSDRRIVESVLQNREIFREMAVAVCEEMGSAIVTEVVRKVDRDYVRDLQKYTEALLKGYKKEIKGLEEKVEKLERELTETREKAYEVISGISF